MGKLFASLLLCGSLSTFNAFGAFTCAVSGVPTLVRSEGLTELMGDVLLECTGGTAGAAVSGNLSVFLTVAITNRLQPGNVVDVVLTADTGTGTPFSTGATPTLTGQNAVLFNGVNFTLPANGQATMRISGLRGAVAPLGQSGNTPIHALVTWNGTDLAFTNPSPTVAVTHVGLLAAGNSTIVNCRGSALPSTIDIPSLFAQHTALSAQRVTEGFATAFQPGIRFILTYSGFPANSRLFVPDGVAGSTATLPTATGLLGPSAAAGGVYTPGSGSLLLVRVLDPDSDGSGGTPVVIPGLAGTTPVSLNSVSEVPLADGGGIAVYEVVDANTVVSEYADIPTWLGLPPVGTGISPRQSVTFAPVSEVDTATATDPVPRFVAVEPPGDCTTLGECASSPRLGVDHPSSLEFTVESGSRPVGQWVWLKNEGGGAIAWTSSVTYLSGSDWIRLANIHTVSEGPGGISVSVVPKKVAPGVYEAVLNVNGGDAGMVSVPIKLTVTVPAPVAGGPEVVAVSHAATFDVGPLVPGSLGTLWGSNLAGGSVSVTFDSFPAQLLYTSEHQMNLAVPADLNGRSIALMTVTVDGMSTQQVVNLTPIAPGIFMGGVLNEDGTVNSPENPAAAGSEIMIFATGLPAPGVGAISAKIHDVWFPSPDFAGPAPGLIGVQQINVRVPDGLPPMNAPLIVCGTSIATGTQTCSPQVSLAVQ
jgi:uncharacterized protein (TIGR03437 family)